MKMGVTFLLGMAGSRARIIDSFENGTLLYFY